MKSTLFSFICLTAFVLFSCQEKTQKPIQGLVHQFDMQKIADAGTLNHQWVKSAEFKKEVMSVTVANRNNELVLTPDSEGVDWASAKYLVCEVWHENPYSVLMRVQFFRKAGDESSVASQGQEDRLRLGSKKKKRSVLYI